ncbi:hypothetical protein ACJX0J_031747, partial [Zea mays]
GVRAFIADAVQGLSMTREYGIQAQGNVALGERAAEELAKLDQTHGASKIALSNIYADAGHWINLAIMGKFIRADLQHKKHAACI